jgi:hypothetical protein
MNRSFLITEDERRRIIGMHQTATKNQYIMEKYEGGLIMEGDDLCDIECEDKIAAYGSNGEAVKEIQHALSKCGYNIKYEGGGMNSGCAKDKKNCDGKFRQHTRDAVKEFQRANGLTVDGKVGSITLAKLVSEGCLEDPQCDCKDFQEDDYIEDVIDTDPIKIIDTVDCEKLKKCIKNHILTPVPDYPSFEKCIGDNEKKRDSDREDPAELDKDGFVEGCAWFIRTNENTVGYKRIMSCPDYLNCMPSTNKQNTTYCNSKAIQACKAKGCTKITY